MNPFRPWRSLTVSRALGAGALLACLAGAPLSAQTSAPERPQYGGTLNVGTVYVTLSALTWEPADWNWKFADDTGQYFERLFSADFSKAKRNGGKYAFRDNNYLPLDAIRGELAESWSWKENPLRLEVKLRKGIMFPEKKGVMAARELVAEDVVFSYDYMAKSPKAIKTYWENVVKVEALDRHTVQYTFKDYHAEWDTRSGYGHYAGVFPKEVIAAGAANWKNHNGTGPFMLTDFVSGNSNTYTKNPNYWDKERIGGAEYKLPFVDRLVYRTIKDESAQHAALRTGKLDILERIRWSAADDLKKTSPALKWERWVASEGNYLSLRMDQKPFDDIRVRRAMNMAINKAEIIKSFYGGNAEMLGFPMHPEWPGYYEPLSAMPESVKELFTYNPDKAKRLLAEAGYPNGFTFKVQVHSGSPTLVDLLPMLAAYLERVGVKMQIQQMEYAAFLSTMSNKSHAPGFLMSTAHGSPTISITKLFRSEQQWNTSMYADANMDKRMLAMFSDRVESRRQQSLKEMTRELLDLAPYVWLPTPYEYSAWWPWVKNYGGEQRGGGGRPGPVYARIWVDQELKKKMGFN
jgi:peptide/nickel transport system substrate-binding protein